MKLGPKLKTQPIPYVSIVHDDSLDSFETPISPN